MRFLFPCDPLDERKPDPTFEDQVAAFEAIGFSTALASDDGVSLRQPKLLKSGQRVVYRGWMLSEAGYASLASSVAEAGGELFIGLEEYLAAHYLPNWYERLADATPQTIILPENADLEETIESLNWRAYFIKDYVKSLKTSVGSLIESSKEIRAVLAEMKKYRDEIEGGVCIREYEDLLPGSEVRYFVLLGKVSAPDAAYPIPDVARYAASRIASKFFSIDVARRTDGTERIVEIGDGQVSDLVGWSAERFAQLWLGA